MSDSLWLYVQACQAPLAVGVSRQEHGSGCHALLQVIFPDPGIEPRSLASAGGFFVCLLSLQLCLTLWDPMDYSPPGSYVHQILQARILDWVAMSSSRGSSRPRDWTVSSVTLALQADFFTAETPGKPRCRSLPPGMCICFVLHEISDGYNFL